jgi:hypothetical protein
MLRAFLMILFFLILNISFSSEELFTIIKSLESTYIDKEKKGILRFNNISINFSLLINALIGAKAFDPQLIKVINYLKLNKVKPLKIDYVEIELYRDKRVITFSQASNNSIRWDSVKIENALNKTDILIKNLNLSSPIFNEYEIPSIQIEELHILVDNGKIYLFAKGINLFKGNITRLSINIGNQGTNINILGIRGIDLNEILRTLVYFNKELPLSITGKFNVDEINLNIYPSKTFSLEIKNFHLQQNKGQIFLTTINYTPKNGLNIRGNIDNFLIKVNNQPIYFEGFFTEGNELYSNKFDINLDINSAITLTLEGFLNFQSDNLIVDLENSLIHINFSKLNKNQTNTQKKEQNIDLSKFKVSLPALPFNLYVIVKQLKIAHNLSVPYIVFKPLMLKYLRIIYNNGKYLFYAPICYTDLILTTTKSGDIQISWIGLNVPLSAIVGCVIEDIKNNYLKKIFFNGKIYLSLNVVIPKGYLKDILGFYEFSLQNGFFLLKKKEKANDIIDKFYSLSTTILNLFGLDLPVFRYSLYTAGILNPHKEKLVLNSNLYIFILNPIQIRVGALILGEISNNLSRKIFKVSGSTYFPFKEVRFKQKNSF